MTLNVNQGRCKFEVCRIITEHIDEEKRAGKGLCWRMLMMPFKVFCGEPKQHRVTLREGGVHDGIRQRWYQKWTPVMSQLPAVLAVSYFCGWTFELRLTVNRWWMRLQSVWVTGHERLHHHSLDNSFLPLPSKKKRKKKGKRNVWVMRHPDKQNVRLAVFRWEDEQQHRVLFVFRWQ